MGLSSHPLHEISQKVLEDERDTHVRSDSNIECWEPNPQCSESFIPHGFPHRIENILIRHDTISIWLHLLNLRFCIIKRQTAKGRKKSRN